MIETKIEKLANKLQIFWFIIDSLKNGGQVDSSILEKADKSLQPIKELLYQIEKETNS